MRVSVRPSAGAPAASGSSTGKHARRRSWRCRERRRTPHGPVASTAAVAPRDEAVVERSKQFLRAVDDGDVVAATAMLAPGFLRVGSARFYGEDLALASVRARKERGFPKYSDRTFELVKARFFGDAAIVTAISAAKVVRAKDVAATPVARSETFVWSFGGGEWRLANWQEELAGEDVARAMWNEAYRTAANFSVEPSKVLIEAVLGRKPGRAVDVGMGQGRNALYLASQGWDVLGVDFADEGLRQAEESARRDGLRLRTENADLATWDWGENRWDLISYLYMFGDVPVDKVRRALKRGGLVVIETFLAKGIEGIGVGGAKKGELAERFREGFSVLRDEETVDVAEWGLERLPLARFVAQKL